MSERYIASFSGGKDSTALALRLIEEDWPLDEIVFFDTGWEFPQMYKHIERFEEYTGRAVTRLQPTRPFTEWLTERPIKARDSGEVYRYGIGWPAANRRWCTRDKMSTIDRHCEDAQRYIGIAADEIARTYKFEDMLPATFPLVTWDMDEADCLTYCYERGFDWGGLYEHFKRVSCFCCPLQRLGELRNLRKHYPELWQKMLDWDEKIGAQNRGFRGYESVHDLEARFACEDRQMMLFKEAAP